MSSLLVLIGPHTQTLTLNTDWIEITIAGLWRGATCCTAPRLPNYSGILQIKILCHLVYSLHMVTLGHILSHDNWIKVKLSTYKRA